jgi:hypothetical protein
MEKESGSVPAFLLRGQLCSEVVPCLTPFVLCPAVRYVRSRSYQATWPKNVLIACALFLVMSLKIRSILIIGESPSK